MFPERESVPSFDVADQSSLVRAACTDQRACVGHVRVVAATSFTRRLAWRGSTSAYTGHGVIRRCRACPSLQFRNVRSARPSVMLRGLGPTQAMGDDIEVIEVTAADYCVSTVW